MSSQTSSLFKTALSMSMALLEMDRELSEVDSSHPQVLPTGKERTRSQALVGAAVVLMVAAFENYLKDLFEVEIRRLTGSPVPIAFRDLPSKMQEISVYVSLDDAVKDYANFGETPKIDRLPEIRRACASVLSEVVNPVAFTRTSSNPNWNTVKSMFTNVGATLANKITPKFVEVSKGPAPKSEDYLGQKLDEIVRARNVVAHGDEHNRHFSRSDVESWYRFLIELGDALGLLLSEHVTQLLSRHGISDESSPRRSLTRRR